MASFFLYVRSTATTPPLHHTSPPEHHPGLKKTEAKYKNLICCYIAIYYCCNGGKKLRTKGMMENRLTSGSSHTVDSDFCVTNCIHVVVLVPSRRRPRCMLLKPHTSTKTKYYCMAYLFALFDFMLVSVVERFGVGGCKVPCTNPSRRQTDLDE